MFKYSLAYSGNDEILFREDDVFTSVVPLIASSIESEKVGEEVGEKVGEKVGENLSPNQVRIIQIIKDNPTVSALKISMEIKISLRKTEENIRKLRKLNIIQRIGPAKGGVLESA